LKVEKRFWDHETNRSDALKVEFNDCQAHTIQHIKEPGMVPVLFQDGEATAEFKWDGDLHGTIKNNSKENMAYIFTDTSTDLFLFRQGLSPGSKERIQFVFKRPSCKIDLKIKVHGLMSSQQLTPVLK
jgi:hypothetical protein